MVKHSVVVDAYAVRGPVSGCGAFWRRALAAVLLLAVCLAALPAARAEETEADGETTGPFAAVLSDTWLLMDAETGQLLAAKDPDKTKYPASITKILTLGLTLLYAGMDDVITVTDTAVDLMAGATHIALQPGEQLTVRDAVMATMLASANDAANCLAELISGSQAAFADLMNQTARSIGCTGSHFVNASGLPDPDHYTTARDMARITAWALTVPGFRELFATDFYTMPPTNKQANSRSWGTQNAMFVTSAYQVEGAWGGKLGWTEEAHHTMVTTLRRHDRDLILVTMDSYRKEDKYNDGALIVETCEALLTPLLLDEAMVGAASTAMYSGDVLLGSVPFAADTVTVWVPVGTDRAAITTTWQLPQRLEVGDTTPAILTVTLPTTAGCLPEPCFEIWVAQGSLGEVQTTWRSIQAAQDGGTLWQEVDRRARTARGWRRVGRIVLGAAGLVLLAFCIRWVNIGRRNLRRYGSLIRPRRRVRPVRRYR